MKSKKHIPIDEEIYTVLKQYCKQNGIVIKFFVEKLIVEKLKNNGIHIQTH